MNILFVNSWYYPNMKGGAEQSTKLLAEGMAEMGHSVSVISGDAAENEEERDIVNGVRVYRLKTHLHGSSENIFRKIQFKLIDVKNRKIKKFFDEVCSSEEPDVIHTNSLAGISPYIWKLAHEKKIPVVHTIRDYSLCSPRGIYESAAQAKMPYRVFLDYYVRKMKKYSRFVDIVTAPSDYTLGKLLDDGFFASSEHRCIFNAIRLDMEETRKFLQSRRQKKSKAKTAIFVGRLIPIKGILLLVSSFRKIKLPDVKLIVCGEGDYGEELRRMAKDDSRIIFRGHLTQQELEKEYIVSDFAVIPSLWDEPFGRVVIEANKYGLPVITSNRGGIPEIIREMKSGVMFESEDEFTELLENFFERENFDRFYDNIELNIEKYSITAQLKSFEELYKKCRIGYLSEY